MTHEEAIEELKILFANGGMTKDQDKALGKAIANMEKCEVYDEPREMEVCNFEDFTSLIHVDCKINDTYITLPNKGFKGYVWKHARPIKTKVLSFGEWLSDTKWISNLPCKEVDYYFNQYTKYLNDNK